MSGPAADPHVQVRWAHPSEFGQIATLSATIFDPATPPEASYLTPTVRDITSGRHPLARPEDYAVAVDGRTGAVVASAVLFRQPWSLGSEVLVAGRPEIVVTSADYRGRGIMREVLALLHRRSAELGHPAQCITGVPYVYRRVGYDYTHPFGHGYALRASAAPSTGSPPGRAGGLTVRRAAAPDVDGLTALLASGREATAAGTPVDSAYLAFSVDGQDPRSRRGVTALVCEAGDRLHAVALLARGPGSAPARIVAASLDPSADPLAVFAALSRRTVEDFRAQADGAADPTDSPTMQLALGDDHLLYDAARALGSTLTPFTTDHWYFRIPDAAVFLEALAPELTRRLQCSAFRRFRGTIVLSAYTASVRLTIVDGAVSGVSAVDDVRDVAAATVVRVAPDRLSALLTGHSSIQELMTSTPETAAAPGTAALAAALFPRLRAQTMPLD